MFPNGNNGETIKFNLENGKIYLLYSATYSGRYCVFLIITGYNNLIIEPLANNGLTCVSSGTGTNLQLSVSRASWIVEPLPVVLISF